MQFLIANRTLAEKIFLVIKNGQAASLTTNGAVCINVANAASFDGSDSLTPASAVFLGWVGIADEDIASLGFGRVQSWGYRDSVLISHEGSSVTVTVGDALHLITGQLGLNTSTVEALSTVGFKYVSCGTTTTLSAAAYTDGFIRCV